MPGHPHSRRLTSSQDLDATLSIAARHNWDSLLITRNLNVYFSAISTDTPSYLFLDTLPTNFVERLGDIHCLRHLSLIDCGIGFEQELALERLKQLTSLNLS